MTNPIWTCYSDGGCQGNPGPCSWGVVILPPSGGTIENSGFLGHGTNQIAEISAALHGIELIPEGAEVLLISDSQYTLKGLTEWRRGWEAKGFRNSANQPVANQEIWKRLFAAADLRKVKTRWVKGHSGDLYNERCDVLAGEAIRNSRLGTRAAASKVAAPVAAAVPVLKPLAAPVVRPVGQAPDRDTSTIGVRWTAIASAEPERQTVLYGLAEPGMSGLKIVRAETGFRVGAIRSKLWATHWMWLPTLEPT